ncbi:transcriptional regulator [Anaerobacillus arseniciselenatis]|uniref:Regulatory protein MsrR n=1 Tax=Anaerobacillus arseniciselenatis TaxID=85682 RepID=A0A1S2LCU4_9BACI|nr:LCP family protein [Anaerobacillus arseniciselenatis]OIJ10144.1 transcriptional regulator [Anaerobacillus arseniciselenatis]
MSNRGKKREKNSKIKRKVFLLIFLITLLAILSAVAYTTQQYERARQESLRLIEESRGQQEELEEIEFHPEEEADEYVHVLLVGIDNEGGGRGNTDTIMVAQYQPKNGKAKLVSLMRDTYVSIPGYRDNKINASFALGGPELLRKTIKENFGINIHYYALIDFNGFVRVVDIISPDGIEVDIERRMFYQDGAGDVSINFQPGLQRLDGKQALNYVRFRNDSENDFGRVRRQQEVLSILKDDLLTFSGVTRLPSLLGSIEPYIQTNLQSRQMLDYGRDFFLNPVGDVETLTIPADGHYTDARYSHAGAVLELDMEKNKQILHEFLELDELVEIDPNSSNN